MKRKVLGDIRVEIVQQGGRGVVIIVEQGGGGNMWIWGEWGEQSKGSGTYVRLAGGGWGCCRR